ncbi:NADPH-dependent diflavin oxidoreductase 1-like isoform X1 [Hibiscus syriacus]|uniref:NADPH-dependent diflavin oxidoreductase 1-like isoform X1 n=1 Tax=Hibiscus syriacus TaxID=106335 RepID=A0A6A2YVL0_HIBSY|nr:uncharacterized protein LOC120155922 [Hibiscus syriacus]KAE8683478.1 NADPH-dependent diflavin oxidoreductase 1-like isoform X1 [Hibiscus syriacus]
MPTSSSFLRQLSGKQGWKSKSCRWGMSNNVVGGKKCVGFPGTTLGSQRMEQGVNMFGNDGGDYEDDDGLVLRKRVMVVVDQSSHSKHAMMWALTHVVNKGDFITLLRVISPIPKCSHSSSSLDTSLESLCKACKPQVEVETVAIQGPKLSTVMSLVKKLGVSVLVLGQKSQSPFLTCLCGKSNNEEFVEQCITNIDRNCLTIGVRKQSNGVGGYLITTRWLNNFWLLA